MDPEVICIVSRKTMLVVFVSRDEGNKLASK